MSLLQPGCHACSFYETEEQRRAQISPYIRHGIELNQKVIYIGEEPINERVAGYLRADGVDVERHLKSGQLSFLPAAQTYAPDGKFLPDRMVATVADATRQALDEGYSALRGAGEIIAGSSIGGRVREYEKKLNSLFPETRCIALCQYDRRRFDAASLLDVLAIHPIAMPGTEPLENSFYAPSTNDPSAEAALRRRLQRLQEPAEPSTAHLEWLASTLKSVGMGVIATDERGFVKFMNPAAESLAGWNAIDASGRHLMQVFSLKMQNPDVFADSPLEEVKRRGTAVTHTDRILVSREGRDVLIHDSAAPLLDARGDVAGVVIVFRDVSQDARQEEERFHAQKTEVIRVLTSGIGKDFSPIMAVILGSSDLLLQQLPPNDPRREHAQKIREAADRGAALARQLRDLSRKG